MVRHRADRVSSVASLDPSDRPPSEPSVPIPEEPILVGHRGWGLGARDWIGIEK